MVVIKKENSCQPVHEPAETGFDDLLFLELDIVSQSVQ
jgi:hypothetical protein